MAFKSGTEIIGYVNGIRDELRQNESLKGSIETLHSSTKNFIHLLTATGDSLTEIASERQPESEFWLPSDAKRRVIDLIINFIGFVSYGNDKLMNCHPASLTVHTEYENALIDVFNKNPEMRDLMYLDGHLDGDPTDSLKPKYAKTGRDWYAKGLNWRMTNLIQSGFFRLYGHLMDGRIQQSHFYYLVKLVADGMRSRATDSRVFIPSTYARDVISILGKLWCQVIHQDPVMAKGPVTIDHLKGKIDHSVERLGTYEYSIFVSRDGSAFSSRLPREKSIKWRFCDKRDVIQFGFRMSFSEIAELLRAFTEQCGKTSV